MWELHVTEALRHFLYYTHTHTGWVRQTDREKEACRRQDNMKEEAETGGRDSFYWIMECMCV